MTLVSIGKRPDFHRGECGRWCDLCVFRHAPVNVLLERFTGLVVEHRLQQWLRRRPESERRLKCVQLRRVRDDVDVHAKDIVRRQVAGLVVVKSLTRVAVKLLIEAEPATTVSEFLLDPFQCLADR